MTAVYDGHSTHAGSTSAPFDLTVAQAALPGFTLTASPTTFTVAQEDVPLMAPISCLDRSYRCGTHLERIHTTYAERAGI
jgi:hypothetical protein